MFTSSETITILIQVLFASNIAAITLSISSIVAYHNISNEEREKNNSPIISNNLNSTSSPIEKYQHGVNFKIKLNDSNAIYSVVFSFAISEILLILFLIWQTNVFIIVSYGFFILGFLILVGIYTYLYFKSKQTIKEGVNKKSLEKLDPDTVNKYARP